MDKSQLVRFARLGAVARLAEIEHERQAILRAFPDLRRARPEASEGAAPAAATTRGKRGARSAMSGTAQGGQRTDAEVLGRPARRQRTEADWQIGGKVRGKVLREVRNQARPSEDVRSGPETDRRRAEGSMGGVEKEEGGGGLKAMLEEEPSSRVALPRS